MNGMNANNSECTFIIFLLLVTKYAETIMGRLFNPFASEAVYTRNFLFRPPVGQRVNTHSVF